MSNKSDALRLADIVDQIDFVVRSVVGKTLDDFLADRQLHQSVAFSLQVIGEAANNLSADAKAKASAVPWPQIVALRHRIVHGYFALELTEIWRIATVDAPKLKSDLQQSGLLQAP
jgi:uncharacterized protein with HEPN domain